ncbi:MAG: flagellar export chaperone FlgN [Campylobacter sp.]|uniref:flagellar export chaperone FlgN n=1 Tax=Campylobacter sp. TaxID=205 RepID=UPI0029736F0C|nr:flagellar export chaperone FlgN [Campylobacter sp.]MDD7600341.1 flagellar export chaperone FlgN [Campylobacteraceae bacterium]MDY5886757.1 flagellar export chaperone FlgN [Campylobacter sp.]
MECLAKIIALTKEDIENIKQAKHDEVGPHSELKTKLLTAFETNKKALDAELVKLASKHAEKNIAELLDDEIKDKLSELRTVLLELKDINREYAKSVVVVKEFFDSLVGVMLGKPTQNSYTDKALGSSKDEIFKARV